MLVTQSTISNHNQCLPAEETKAKVIANSSNSNNTTTMAVLSSLSRVAAASRSAVAKSTSKRSFSAIYSVADEFPE